MSKSSNNSNDDDTRGVMPFVWLFALTYAGLTVLVFILISLLSMPPNSGLAIGALIGSATLASQRFIAEVGRAPNWPESLKLTGLSFLAVVILAVPIAFAMASASGVSFADVQSGVLKMIEELGPQTFAGVVAFSILMHLALLYLSYGPLASFLAGREKKK